MFALAIFFGIGCFVFMFMAALRVHEPGSGWLLIASVVCIFAAIAFLLGELSSSSNRNWELAQSGDRQAQRIVCGSTNIGIYLNCLENNFEDHPDLTNFGGGNNVR